MAVRCPACNWKLVPQPESADSVAQEAPADEAEVAETQEDDNSPKFSRPRYEPVSLQKQFEEAFKNPLVLWSVYAASLLLLLTAYPISEWRLASSARKIHDEAIRVGSAWLNDGALEDFPEVFATVSRAIAHPRIQAKAWDLKELRDELVDRRDILVAEIKRSQGDAMFAQGRYQEAERLYVEYILEGRGDSIEKARSKIDEIEQLYVTAP